MTNYKRPRGQYVLGKISKVRWLPSNTRSGQISPSFFVYGSWDEVFQRLYFLLNQFFKRFLFKVGSSTVELWHWPSSDILGLEFNEEVSNSFEALPRQRAKFTHDFGDVNDLVVMNAIRHFEDIQKAYLSRFHSSKIALFHLIWLITFS